MSPAVAVGIVLLGCYLVGAIPFGFLIGLANGVNLFRVGSGNIGATNVTRTLGTRFGALCFVLDFLKGAIPVAVCVPIAETLQLRSSYSFGSPSALQVAVAALAFLGHLFPIYLGFRGGKGVATGAGVLSVLVPGPAAFAVLAWVIVVVASRYVSLASIAAVIVLSLARMVSIPHPFAGDQGIVTGFVLFGAAVVIVKHRANIARLRAGTENQIGDGAMRYTVLKGMHVVALGIWVGAAGFFNFGTAPAIFASFKSVVNDGPSDRTANVRIVPDDATQETKNALASALAGSAVGPVFPIYFMLQTICAGVALVTALSWWSAEPRRLNRTRVVILGLAALTVAVAWPISLHVSELRLERFSADATIAAAAKDAFGSWHLVSLFLSFVTIIMAGIGLTLCAKLPNDKNKQPARTVAPAVAA